MAERTCREPGCEVTWEVQKASVRPRVWCDEHGTTAASSRRNRAEPRKPKSACCPVRGKCPQHKQAWPQQKVRNSRAMFARNREVLLDFVDIFGHAMILNERGNMAIYMWMPVSDEDEVGAHEQRVRNYHGR